MSSRQPIRRRDFLRHASAAVAAVSVGQTTWAREKTVPSYLAGYEMQYADDPQQAAVAWFSKARFACK